MYRSLTLLGLVLVFMVVASNGWAQFLVEGGELAEKYTQYPFLGVDNTQRNMLINAFNFQSRIFTMMSGTGVEKVEAFNILAILGALVGALLLFFNAKIRKPMIVAPWLIVLILLVFAPYGSKLLFYPVSQQSLQPVFTGPRATIVEKDCVSAPEICGFAPQIVAVHVASTLQMLFSDAFRSAGWEGLMESFKARAELSGSPNLNLNPQVIQRLNEYDKACSSTPITNHVDTLFPVSSAAASTPTGAAGSSAPAEDQKTVPIRFADKWKSITNEMNNADIDVGLMPPDAIELWDDAAFKTAMTENGWGQTVQQEYEAGLTQLYQAAGGIATVSIDATTCSDAESCAGKTKVSALTALRKLEDSGFFKIYQKDQPYGEEDSGRDTRLLPGFFVYWDGAKNNDSKSTEPADETFSAAGARACYQANSGELNMDPSCRRIGTNYGQQLTYVKDNFFSSDNSIFSVPEWQIMSAIQDPRSAISRMPVKPRRYSEGVKTDEGTSKPVVQENKGGQNCEVDGVNTIKEIINLTVGPEGTTNKAARKDMFSNTQKLLLGETPLPARITLKDVCNDVTDPDTASEECHTGAGLAADEEITNIGKNMALFFDEIVRANSTKTTSEKNNIMLREFLRLIQESSMNARKGDPDAAQKAAQDGTSPEVVGARWLTSLGGGIATLLGSFIVQIGSWFVGPLSAAIIFFLTMLVDMSLMILIILTPFLLLAGLFVPGNAIGVLTVSIVGVFVLKFVPVTLVILNYLGAMIYTFVGYGADPELAKTMQSMIIIAMGGMYASLVTMTFFLLFKMGDASAILSRFTALDNNAKEIAQRGMGAALTLASAAAIIAGGGVAAALGRGSMGLAAKKAAANLGIPPGWVDAAKGLAETPNKDAKTAGNGKEGPEGVEDLPTEPLDGLTAEERAMRDQNDDILGAKLDQAGLERAKKQNAASDAKEMLRDVYGRHFEGGISAEEAEKFVDEGRLVKEDKYGNMREFQLTKNGDAYGVNPSGITPKIAGASETVGTGIGSTVGDAIGTDAQANAALSETNGMPTAEGGANTSQAAAGGGGIPASVTIAGGSLSSIDSVGEVGRIQQSATEQASMQDRVKEIAAEKEAERQAAENKDALALANNTKLEPTQREQLSKIADELDKTTDEDRREELFKQQDDVLKQAGKTKAGMKRDELLTRNMNDQIAEALLRFDSEHGEAYQAADKKKQSGGALSKQEKELMAIRDGLANFDTAGVAQGEIMSRLGTFESLNASLRARAGADNLPSLGASVLSGMYGGLTGAGGGLAKIPVIGPAITESINEFYQAPERARAAAAVGGLGAWWSAQGNAKRMGFYQKEMTPLVAAQQYESMSTIGGFQAQADLARQAANEAVARSRSQWEAMVASRAPTLSMDLRNEILSKNPNISQSDLQVELSRRFNEKINSSEFKVVMSAGELSGLGRLDAADKIASVRQEAFLMQGASLDVKRVKGGLDGNMMLKAGSTAGLNVEVEQVGVVLTPEALARVRGDLTTKATIGKYDDMMLAHYGLAEKQYLRGDADWDSTRNMNTSGAAARMFARKDVSTDYLIGGHLKMVSGKEKFLEGKAQYETLVKFRNETNNKIAEFMQTQLAGAGGQLSKVLADAGVQGKLSGLSGRDLAVNTRMELEKWAGKQMVANKEYLPLNLLFESADARGRSSYELKAKKARSEIAAENAAVWEAVDKARRAAVASALPSLNSSAKKAAKTEWNGFNIEAGAPLEIFTEWLDSALGTASEEILGKLSKAIPSAMQDSFLRSEKRTIKIDGKDYREVVSYMNKDAFAELQRTMNEEQRKAFLAEKKYYREANGRIELSRTVMGSDGSIREDLSHNR